MKNLKWVAQSLAFCLLVHFFGVSIWEYLANACEAFQSCGVFLNTIPYSIAYYSITISAACYFYLRMEKSFVLYSDRWSLWKGPLCIVFGYAFTFVLAGKLAFVGNLICQKYFSNFNDFNYATSDVRDSMRRFSLNPYWFLFSSALLVPIKEELCYRGLIFSKWSENSRPYMAVILTSLFFAFAHISSYSVSLPIFMISGFPSLFLIGVFFGFLRVRFTLFHAIAAHILWNALHVGRIWAAS